MTSDLLPLRQYQHDTISAIKRAWLEVDRPAVVLPTGAGKTVIFAHLAADVIEAVNEPALVLVHTNELVNQAVDKFRKVAPHLRVGVVKAERNEVDADVVVATIQSVRSRTDLLLKRSPAWLTIVDECHHATAASYQHVMTELGGRAVGFTATLARGDGAALNTVWQKVAYRRDITDMIALGYLLPVRGKRVRVPDLNLRDVKTSHGEYQADELGEALSASLAPELVAKAYVEHASERLGILFAPTVDSAYVFAEALNAAGITAETVHGGTDKHERAAILHRLREGETQVVCNCMVLTEGFDEPAVSCVVICRPTTSGGLFVQMAGRALRPYPGQTDALVLDVVGVTGKHRLASMVDLVGDPTKIRREPEEESLADLLVDENGFDFEGEEEEPRSSRRPHTYVGGDEIEVIEVDLFRKSHSAWLQTSDSVWFLGAGRDAWVFLAPAGGGGTYNVAVTDKWGRGEFRYRRVPLDAAMAWGEEVAREVGGAGVLLARKATWRKDRPSEKQAMEAARNGVTLHGFETRGDVSDLISIAKSSKVIDGLVRGWKHG